MAGGEVAGKRGDKGDAPAAALRHPGLTRPIGAVLPAVTRLAFRAAGPGAAVLVADWAAIVGPALAAVSSPRRFSAGTLVLGCSGPVAMELQHLGPQLMQRINGHLGREAVLRIRLVQEAVRAPGLGVRDARARAPVVPAEVEGLPDGPLRDALVRLGGHVRTRR